MSRVYVTRQIAPSAIDLLRAEHEVTVWGEDRPMPRAELLSAAAQADGLLCMLTDRIDAELLDAAPELRVVSQMAVGYDNIDVPACTARGIPVGNTPGVLTECSADLAFALMLAAARRLPEGERHVRGGHWGPWSPNLLLGQEVSGATLGIVGFGRIGQAVARRARGFGMKLLYHGGSDRQAARELGAEERPLDALLRESDFVSIHVPLKKETYHLISTRELARMKPTAVLVNTARGGVVDPAALYEALRDRRIFAAALDVTEPEPIRMDDPLLTLDNCLIVPHIASASVQTRTAMATLAARNLLAALRGEKMLHSPNPEVLAGRIPGGQLGDSPTGKRTV
ncbi:MAG: D-glycerate dehydrogenase [Chloroflexi bacterium]|nr:D-glycerate dehydrogenase [Chloroflexota bacterium]